MVIKRHRDETRKKSTHQEARYANYFEVGHNAFEFLFDFGQYHPESESAKMHSRIVTGPPYAKLLADLLRSALRRFEEEHGAIHPLDDELDPVEIVKQSIAGYDSRFNTKRRKKRG
jgi:hypothetical protein